MVEHSHLFKNSHLFKFVVIHIVKGFGIVNEGEADVFPQDVEQVGSEEACRLNCPRARGNLVPQPGIKLTSSALEGRFLTTQPSGKSTENDCFNDDLNNDPRPQ